MYLSRVKIDTENRKKMQDLNHLGAYHHWVEESFPKEIENNERLRKLWRVDSMQGNQYLLVVSQNKPNLEKLENYGVVDSAESKDYDYLLGQLAEGNHLRFRVTLNPIKSLSTGKKSGERGHVIPLVTDEQQLQFLMDKSQKNGFLLDDSGFTIVKKGFEVLKKKKGKRLRICTATYEGMLTITDLDQFKSTLMNGFGKKKAYGFGLLTVIPAQ